MGNLEFQTRPSQASGAGLYLYPNYELPSYEHADVVRVRAGKEHEQGDYGTTALDVWRIVDETETEFKVMFCRSAHPRTNVWVVKDTAWGTQPEGLNVDVARKLMSMGFNVLIKGPEINTSIPQSRSAFNTHLLLDAIEEEGDLEAEHIAVEGYSRGSMVGFGTNAYAPKFDRQVLYSNFTDPCVGRPIKPDVATAQKGLTLPIDLGLLGLAVLRTLNNPRRASKLVDTVNFSKEGLGQFVRTGIPLFNGEAGAMAERVPHDMRATIAFFRRCRVNDNQIYRQLLRRHLGVRFVAPEGGHGGGIDARIIGNVAVRFGRLADQLEEGRTQAELNYDYILRGSKKAA